MSVRKQNLLNCDREISYFERKKQDPSKPPCILNKKGIPATVKSYRTLEILKKSGLEFISSNPIFNIVETSLYPERNVTQTNTEVSYSFLYIISKYIGDQLYFKLGSGGNFKGKSQSLRLNRIEGAQTFLIPGIGNNLGFQVHFLIFFRKTPYLDKSSVHEFIEKSIHKILQIQFKASNFKFGTENSSEWYLLRKPVGKSDDPKYFCGFILDVMTTYANYDEILSPNIIWKLSEENKYTKQIVLSPIEESQSRLVMANGIYYTILTILESKGIRRQRPYTVEIEEGDDASIRKRKGTIQMYREEILDKGDMIMENDEKVGRLWSFSGKEYIIVGIILNKLKYSFGQPLETNEIYVKFRPYNTKNVPLEDFEQHNIRIIPKYEKKDELELIFSDYYMKIEDYLKIIKPPEIDMKNWPLKENYEYYELRRQGKTFETFYMTNNVELPNWYFGVKAQDFWSKVFVGSITNPKYKKYQEPHVDMRVNVESDKTQYEWKVVARTIYKNDESSSRSNILLKRITTRDPIIEEEIPVTRLMMLHNVIENVEEKTVSKQEIMYGDPKKTHYMIKKDFSCRLPEGYFQEGFEYNKNITQIMATYRVHKVYEKHLYQGGENIEIIDYMEIGQIFPHDKFKTYHVPIYTLPESDKLFVIQKPKLSKGNILKFTSLSLSKGVNPSKRRKVEKEGVGKFEDMKGKKIYYSMRDLKYIGIDAIQDTNEEQYVKIESILVEDEPIYKLQYLPPYDKVKNWPFPYVGEKVEKVFEDNVNYKGVVTNVEPLEKTKENIYSIVYEDNEKEDLYLSQLQDIMLNKKKRHENPTQSVFHYVYADDLDKYLQKKFFIVSFPSKMNHRTQKKSPKKVNRNTRKNV